ncbi:chemotaxis protein CheB [Aridibaculum aurantiacum]|uniref:chemotaxis protein CheB n=1 Tax=Aridibaculum aurantiacum TaxID=2810307 RepID=UPI001A95EAEE|nr:chemotaxis protein CheB [Aridibaculum aurantiacum]
MEVADKILLIGGSAGSLPVLIDILKALPSEFQVPVVLVLHRQRNVVSEMKQVLSSFHQKEIREPDDKDPVEKCCIYLAPQNYHLLIEDNKTFSLDYSEVVRFSRPAIDVTFESAAMIYKAGTIAVLLSGANNDGTEGLRSVISNGGVAIVQDPSTAEFAAMPLAAISANKQAMVMTPEQITHYLLSLNNLK